MEEKGTTAAVLDLDVGNASHWACGVDSSGRVVLSERVANRAVDVDAALTRAGSGDAGVFGNREIDTLARPESTLRQRMPTCLY